MASIVDPTLRVEPLSGRPGERLVVVSYGIRIADSDDLSEAELVEEVVVESVDREEKSGHPLPLKLTMRHRSVVGQPGLIHRILSEEVHRIDLDVQQDWWRADKGGGVEPIVEYTDHIVGEITLSVQGDVVARSSTPVLSGSWGPLGDD